MGFQVLSLDFAAISLLLALLIRRYLRRDPIAHVRGPPGAEWLVGEDNILRNQEELHTHEFSLFKRFGNVVKIKGSLRSDNLLTADPKALQYIFQTATYRFPKPNDHIISNEVLFGGKGLIVSIGDSHSRQRKIMLPGFSAGQLRTFLGIFQNVGAKLGGKWIELVSAEGTVVNVADWLARATLEVIGESAFQYKFNSVEGDHADTELGIALDQLFIDSQLHPSRSELIFNAICRFCPRSVSRVLNVLPSKQNDRFRKYFALSVKVIERMIAERRSAPIESTDRDLLSVLLRANMAEDPSKRLTDEEVIAQLALVIVAGHDTTAATMTWMLWELAKRSEIQERLRKEIQETRERVGKGNDFTSADYDSMSFLNAVVKETLRFHPVVSTLDREAGTDDVIPLAEPLLTKKGMVTEIPVSRGQIIHASFAGYNRLKSVWGEDAEEWIPDRWLGLDWRERRAVSVGMTSNLMTFSAGVQGCIGWKFAIMEAQALTTHLIETFEFALPDDKPRILRLPTAIMLPMIDGQFEKGTQMPLLVKPVEGHA